MAYCRLLPPPRTAPCPSDSRAATEMRITAPAVSAVSPYGSMRTVEWLLPLQSRDASETVRKAP